MEELGELNEKENEIFRCIWNGLSCRNFLLKDSFNSIDVNEDGFIDKTELKKGAGYLEYVRLAGEEFHCLVQQSYICGRSSEYYDRVDQQLEASIDRLIEKYDTNKDGKLSLKEFMTNGVKDVIYDNFSNLETPLNPTVEEILGILNKKLIALNDFFQKNPALDLKRLMDKKCPGGNYNEKMNKLEEVEEKNIITFTRLCFDAEMLQYLNGTEMKLMFNVFPVYEKMKNGLTKELNDCIKLYK